jgi:hypothetical protein
VYQGVRPLGFRLVRCARCGAVGEVKLSALDSGKGYEGWHRVPAYQSVFNDDLCPTCYAEWEKRACPRCHGRGYKPFDGGCWLCKGTGEVDDVAAARQEMRAWSAIDYIE